MAKNKKKSNRPKQNRNNFVPNVNKVKEEAKTEIDYQLQEQRKQKIFAKIASALCVALIVFIAAFFISQNEDLLSGLEGTLGIKKKTNYTGFYAHFIDVGQGDCTLIVCDNEYMLVDAGEAAYGEDVLNYLSEMGIKNLDYVVATHPHSDHIGGLNEVLENVTVENLVETPLSEEQTPDSYLYKSYCDSVEENGCSRITAYSGMTFTVGTAEVKILGPVTDETEDLNNMSIVMTITYGENVFLLSGDAEQEEELTLLEKELIPDCDVLKVGHHGSSGSTSSEFLEAAKPETCIIEVGEDNEYGHPSDKAIDRISEYTDDVYRTDFCGDIVVKSDGENITVSYKNSDE